MTAAELIPRAVLLGRPDRFNATPSPAGPEVAYLTFGAASSTLWAAHRAAPRQARPLWSGPGVVRDFAWCCGGRHLLYLSDRDGDERWRLHVIDPASGQRRTVTPDGPGVSCRLLAHHAGHPDHAVVTLGGRPVRLDLRTGLTEPADPPPDQPAERAPAFSRWLVDRDLTVRGGFETHADAAVTVHHRRHPGQPYRPLLTLEPDDAAGTDVVGFDRTGALLYLVTPLDADVRRLVALDTATGRYQVLAQRPGHDLDTVSVHPDTFAPDLVGYAGPRPAYQALTEDLQADLDVLLGHDDGGLSLRRAEGDRHWTVSFGRPDRPVRYHSYHRPARDLRPLFAHRDDLAGRPLAAVEPFTATARDGLTLHGYRTRAADGGPAVLNVHGGPWTRDTWSYDPVVQWLANRGYTCLQVNFRGSTGYGKRFAGLGNRQWGAAMLDDLLDTVGHAARQGWVDPARVGILGGSYGGYAALAAMALRPGAFRCAVSLCGPSSLVTLLESLPPEWAPVAATMHRRIGHPVHDRALLLAQSPLPHADAIAGPVLIAHGANDPRVRRRESESIAGRLRTRGVECELLVFPDEGHGLVHEHNIQRFYAAAERFLARHLGGRFE